MCARRGNICEDGCILALRSQDEFEARIRKKAHDLAAMIGGIEFALTLVLTGNGALYARVQIDERYATIAEALYFACTEEGVGRCRIYPTTSSTLPQQWRCCWVLYSGSGDELGRGGFGLAYNTIRKNCRLIVTDRRIMQAVSEARRKPAPALSFCRP